MMASDRIVQANGVELCVETFGDPGDPAILLIGGAASSMDWWEDDFCAQLAAGQRFVIRYDSRDTGRSTSYPKGSPDYSLTDLADDVIGLLDALKLTSAHLVGVSMGGAIVQWLAVEHPDRVESLTLISTSPGGPGGGPDSQDLPPMSDRLQASFAKPRQPPDWTDRASVIEYLLEGQRRFAGTLPLDEDRVSELAGRAFDRTRDMAASMTNHWVIDGGDSVRDRLGQVGAPTLVIHGTADPLFPLGHAEAMVKEVPGSRLLSLDGVGHQVPPPPVWDVVVPAILKLTSEPDD
jgi:pimeloyl-ACP methyl ester carboxylesterase